MGDRRFLLLFMLYLGVNYRDLPQIFNSPAERLIFCGPLG